MVVLILTILKFASLAIATTSGIVGTIAETRDKENKKLTKPGKLIVFLIIISSIVATSIQAIEVYIQNIAAEEDRKQRIQEFEALYSLTHPLGELNFQINITYPFA